MALNFGIGSDNYYVNHGTLGSYNMAQGTILAWANMQHDASGSGAPAICGKRTVTETLFFGTVFADNNDIRFRFDRVTTRLDIQSSDDPIVIPGWMFLAATWDSTLLDADQHLYHGSLTALASECTYGVQQVGAGAIQDVTGNDFYIGGGGNNLCMWYGYIANLGIWTTQLSLAQIQAQQFHPHVTANCKLFTFPGFHGATTVPDLSGNGYNGTVTSATVIDHVPLGPPFGFDVGLAYAVGGQPINFAANIQAQSGTSSPAMNVARPLSAAMALASATSAAALAVLRELTASIQPVSSTSSGILSILRELIASIAAQAATSTPALSVLRELSASINAGSLTSSSAVSVLRELAAAIAAGSGTTAPAFNVSRPLSASISAVSATSDIELVIEGLINFAASIAVVSATSSPALAVSRSLSANIQAQSAMSTAVLAILRELSAAISAATATPAIDLHKTVGFSASIAAQSSTSQVALDILRAITASVQAGSSTSQAVLSVLRQFSASVDITTLTSAINLITAGLGTIIDAAIESLTVKRTLSSLTADRDIESLTPVRTIEET